MTEMTIEQHIQEAEKYAVTEGADGRDYAKTQALIAIAKTLHAQTKARILAP